MKAEISLGTATPYETSPIKRIRRSGEQMDVMLTAIKSIVAGEEDQITIRHLYYRLVGLGIIPKTEAAYKSLCAHLSKWRRSGEIKFSAFADSTRWHYKQPTFSGIEDALDTTVRTYRRNLWSNQDCYVEVWIEKEAIAGLVSKVANSFGVPVFVCRGFASLSSMYSAAGTFSAAKKSGKRPIIYHVGDYDPSGVAAGESVRRAFQDDFNVEVEFFRIAVTQEQIVRLNLPTRPTKTTDTRSRNWTGGDCVEVDTMPPSEIRKLVQTKITQNIDPHQWQQMQTTERLERETLASLKERMFP